MRKLTPDEEHALEVLTKHGSFCPGDIIGAPPEGYTEFIEAIKGLVKKKRAWVEATDGGPRYHPL